MLLFFLILLTFCFTIGLALFLHYSEGPAQDKLQTFIGWSLRCIKHMLALLTIFLAAATISRDIRRKEIFTIATKPISRYQFLAGKVLGLMLLNLGLIIVCGALVYLVAMTLRGKTFTIFSTPIRIYTIVASCILCMVLLHRIVMAIHGFLVIHALKSKCFHAAKQFIIFLLWCAFFAPGWLLAPSLTEVEKAHVDNLVLTARQAAPPVYEELQPEVLRRALSEKIERMVRDQIRRDNMDDPVQIEAMRRRLQATHISSLEKALITVESGDQITWHFRGITPRDAEKGFLFVRFKPDVSNTPDNLKILNRWQFGPKDPREFGGAKYERIDEIRTLAEFPVPVTEISPEGDFYLTYFNHAANRTNVIFPVEDGIELLYVTGTFGENLVRSLGLIYGRLIFLSLLGVAVGAWLSFPVAVLLICMVFIMGVSSSFVTDSVKWQTADLHAAAVKSIMSLVPKFSVYDPVPEIEIGRIVPFGTIARCIVFLLIIKGALVALVGYLIFRFRELARVIV